MCRQLIIWSTISSLLVLAGCGRRPAGLSTIEPYLPDDASVAFKLESATVGAGSQHWIGTYKSKGKTARFGIELGPSTTAATEFNIRSGTGRFVPDPASDSSFLLVDLQKALRAKGQHAPAPKKTPISFAYANIGENLSQASGGGFSVKPAGNWTAIKLFLGEGDQEGELFLNINSKTGTGQFSMKDADYGDLVLAELARVL
jgi:hypothetical protein